MSIEKIMKLAEAQANARVEAAKARIVELEEALQLARDELFDAAKAKNELELLFAEQVNPQGETQEQPKKEEPKEQVTALNVFAAHNKMFGMASAWLVVAAATKEEAETLINSRSYGDLATTPLELATGNLNKKVAAKALDNPRVVHIINSNSRKLREL